jgi:CHAT domain-containing protein
LAKAPPPLAPLEAAWTSTALKALNIATTLPASEDLTPSAVLSLLGHDHLVHAACHAAANPSEPLLGGLNLRGGMVTVQQVIDTDVRARLVVLSACESGAAGRRLPDEVVSLPSALVEAGCSSVIGSMWRVDDQSAALLMLALYRSMSKGTHPASALAEAQSWLRQATNADILDTVRHASVGAVGAGDSSTAHDAYRTLIRQLGLADPGESAFTSPSRWAAFVYVGA